MLFSVLILGGQEPETRPAGVIPGPNPPDNKIHLALHPKIKPRRLPPEQPVSPYNLLRHFPNKAGNNFRPPDVQPYP